jgi:hypothetical protein
MRRTIRFGLAGVLALGILAVAPAAFADHGGGARASGACSMSGTWELRAKAEGGGRDDRHRRIEVEFEVQNVPQGDVWDVTLADNGTAFFQGTRKARGDDGRFRVEKRTRNQPGTDVIDATATDRTTGETCMGSVSL